MDKITGLAFLALLLVCSNNVSASLILDTGSTPDDNAWALGSHDGYSIDVDALLAEMGRYKKTTRLRPDVVRKGAWWSADWSPGRGMVDQDFFTNKHPGWNKRHFKDKWHDFKKWHDFPGHHPGHVPAVPVPAAVWLFGSGLIGLVGVGAKRRIMPSSWS